MPQRYSKVPKILGKKIQKLRKAKKLTQEEFARLVGVSSTYIGFIEQGHRAPSIKTADKIARALGTKFTQLFEKD